MSNPKYDINDVVYFRTSAARGFIEPVRITIVTKINSGWIYGINIKQSQPTAPSVYGDQIVFGGYNQNQVFYSESEFVSYCEALYMSENYLATQLANIQSLIATHCGTGGTNGTNG